jgi:hypothetical protein
MENIIDTGDKCKISLREMVWKYASNAKTENAARACLLPRVRRCRFFHHISVLKRLHQVKDTLIWSKSHRPK